MGKKVNLSKNYPKYKIFIIDDNSVNEKNLLKIKKNNYIERICVLNCRNSISHYGIFFSFAVTKNLKKLILFDPKIYIYEQDEFLEHVNRSFGFPCSFIALDIDVGNLKCVFNDDKFSSFKKNVRKKFENYIQKFSNLYEDFSGAQFKLDKNFKKIYSMLSVLYFKRSCKGYLFNMKTKKIAYNFNFVYLESINKSLGICVKSDFNELLYIPESFDSYVKNILTNNGTYDANFFNVERRNRAYVATF